MTASKTRTGGKHQRPAPVVVRAPVLPRAPSRPLAAPPTPTPSVPAPAPAPAGRAPPARPRDRARAARDRRTERVIHLFAPLEAELVTQMVAVGAGGGAPWRSDLVRIVAARLGVSMAQLQVYLMALRRTLGRSVPFKNAITGPLVRDQAWIDAAMRSRDWGLFQPLVEPNWPGYWEPGPPPPGASPSTAPRFPTRRPPAR